MFPSLLKEKAFTFMRFSILVDKIDFARKQLPPQDRSKSIVLDGLYRKTDKLVRHLKRLGGI